MNYELLSKLIGLVRCFEGNEHLITANTDELLFEGLKIAVCGGDEGSLLQRIESEKQRLAPDCYACTAPCGKRDDMDFSLLVLDDTPVQALKEQLLKTIKTAVQNDKKCDYATALFLYGLIGTGREPLINIIDKLK